MTVADPPASPRATPARALRSDRGASTIEVIAVLTIAALLLTATLVAVRAMDTEGRATSAACRIMSALGIGGPCESTDAPRDPADYLPPEQCVLLADGGSASVRAGVVLIGGADGDWLVEQLGDDTYRLTRGVGLEGGATVGIGFDISVTGDGHRYGVGASAGASAVASFNGGEVYVVGSREEAEALLAAKNVGNVKDATVGPSGPTRWVVDQLHGAFDDTSMEDRVPDETYVAAGGSGEASGVLNAFLGGASAQATVEQALGARFHENGARTVYFRSAASLSGDLQGVAPGDRPGTSSGYGELSGRLEGEYMLEVDYDKDGNATAVTVRATYVKDGTMEGEESRADFEDPDVLNEAALRLPLRTDADREVAMRALYAAGIPYVPGVSDGLDVGQYALSRLTPWDSVQDFGDAAAASGQVWRQTSTRDSSEYGVNFDAAYLAKLQVTANLTTTQRKLQEYEYWNGQAFVARPECGAGFR